MMRLDPVSIGEWSPRSRRRRVAPLVLVGLGCSLVGMAIASAGAGASARKSARGVAARIAPASGDYTFTTIDDPADITFNQLLGVNDLGRIAGYYGSGSSASHPNKGYTISAYAGGTIWLPENYPGSAQTQVTGLNDVGEQVGFWVNAAGDNYGFWAKRGQGATNGRYVDVADPAAAGSTKTTQLLGINNNGVASGFYNDAKGNSHAFTYSIKSASFTPVVPPGASSAMGTGINDVGDVVGTETNAKGATVGFLEAGGSFTTISIPGAASTSALGVNDHGQVVGFYTVGKSTMHGFLWHDGAFVTINDPHGVSSTTINGTNSLGDIVGFYTDASGNTDGFIGAPTFPGYANVPGA